MTRLIATTKEVLEVNETVRLAALTTFTVALAITFLLLLVSDQVQAASALAH